MIQTIVVDLSIDTQEMKRLYRGTSRSVVARARDGRWVQFPAHVLRAHVAAFGVHGAFVLSVEGGHLKAMQRLR